MNHKKIKKQKGLSLIELLIAVLIGVILLVGLISVFETTSRLNKTQNGLARVQENGRYALLYMRQNIEQAGYQYCVGSSLDEIVTKEGVAKQPIVVHTPTLAPGFPTRAQVSQTPSAGSSPEPYLVDPLYLIHGHECNAGTCAPDFSSIGSQASFVVPGIGVADGDRIEDTDVLTIRYYSNLGVKIDQVATINGNVTIDYAETITAPLPSGNVVIASCTSPSHVVNLTSSGANGATATISNSSTIDFDGGGLGKLFDLDTDVTEHTFYVANGVVDGRDIPTLYSVINGVKNAIVQGVDRFDLKYVVKLASGNTQLLDADEVEALTGDGSCVGDPKFGGATLLNGTGCGWRSVIAIELHLLLNTIYNSSNKSNDMFVYSIDGNSPQEASALSSGINHYNMFRREFMSSITLKNY